jgi:HK97 family phage portal protein
VPLRAGPPNGPGTDVITRPDAAAADGDQVRYSDMGFVEIGAGSTAGIRVTPDIALKAAALHACIKVLAETIATVPLRMKRATAEGSADAPEHPLDEIIRYQPNSIQTAVEFWEMMMLHAALRGTGYAEIVPGPRGAVDQLRPLHGDRVEPERLRDGSLRFRVTDPVSGRSRILLQEEVFRIPGMSSDGVKGLRAVDLAADDIGLGMGADQYAARVFSNKLNIGGFLVHPKKLDLPAQRNLVHALMERFAGTENAHRPIVLQEGMKFERASMDADKAQLLDARKWQITLIAMRWRIPLHMLGIYDGATHSNVEQQALDLVKYTLRPWVKRIEQAIRRDLIIATRSYWAEFNLEGLLRGDSAARADYFSKALGSGGHAPWMTVNEVRRIEGYNDIPGGDVIRWPSNSQTPTSPAKPAAIENQSTPIASAKALVHRENTAIRKAQMRLAGDPDGFRTWVGAYFGGHISTVMSVLGIPKEAARVYCEHQKGEFLAANDVPGLLDRRAAELPEQIAGAITNA